MCATAGDPSSAQTPTGRCTCASLQGEKTPASRRLQTLQGLSLFKRVGGGLQLLDRLGRALRERVPVGVVSELAVIRSDVYHLDAGFLDLLVVGGPALRHPAHVLLLEPPGGPVERRALVFAQRFPLVEIDEHVYDDVIEA